MKDPQHCSWWILLLLWVFLHVCACTLETQKRRGPDQALSYRRYCKSTASVAFLFLLLFFCVLLTASTILTPGLECTSSFSCDFSLLILCCHLVTQSNIPGCFCFVDTTVGKVCFVFCFSSYKYMPWLTLTWGIFNCCFWWCVSHMYPDLVNYFMILRH